jgi:hypothetical protein
MCRVDAPSMSAAGPANAFQISVVAAVVNVEAILDWPHVIGIEDAMS